jgi:hypothetical protein
MLIFGVITKAQIPIFFTQAQKMDRYLLHLLSVQTANHRAALKMSRFFKLRFDQSPCFEALMDAERLHF